MIRCCGQLPVAEHIPGRRPQTVAPSRDSKDGLLPPLLVALTAVTGLVDSFSYLVLGHVFVANMTGNVVFLAFALAGVRGFSATASVAAIGCFAVGALITGRLGRSLAGSGRSPAGRRELLLGVTAGIQAVIVAETVTMAALTAEPDPRRPALRPDRVARARHGRAERHRPQARRPGPDHHRADAHHHRHRRGQPFAGATGAHAARRLISVVAMFLGALAGALLVLRVHIVYPLVIALVILAAVAVFAVAGPGTPGLSPSPAP